MSLRSTSTAAALLGAVLWGAAAQMPAFAQTDDPYQSLHKYDPQDRRGLLAIRKQIQTAGADRARQAVIETRLIGVLQDPNATLDGKQEAAHFLWVIGSARSVPVLAKLLPAPATNNLARYALERNADPAAAAALRAALKSTRGAERIGVINSIGNRGDAAAIPSLKVLAVGTDPVTSDAAITALGKVGTETSAAALKSLPNKGIAVDNALLRSAEKLAATAKRPAALALYESLTAAAHPAVIRAGALSGLAALKAPQTEARALAIARTAPEPSLQRAAARIAGTQAAPADTKSAIAAWAGLPVPAQVALLGAWADRKETAAAGVTVAALKSASPDVRAAAIRAAARIGGPTVVPTLVQLAVSGDQAQVAREALAGMGGAGVEAALVKLIQTGPADRQTTVINILAERPTPSSTRSLMMAANGTDARVSSTALKALGSTGGPEEAEMLVSVLASTMDDSVRDAAQSAIVAIAQRSGDRDRAAASLLGALTRSTTGGKAALLGALAEVGGDRALAAVTEATSSPIAEVRNAAVTALANSWSDARALPTLLRLGKDGNGRPERVLSLRGYFRIVAADEGASGAQRLERVQRGMEIAERPEEKRQALSILRDIRTSEAIMIAARALDDPELVAEAADAVLYLAAPQRKGNRSLPAVKGPAAEEALDKVIRTAKDDNTRAQAEKLRRG